MYVPVELARVLITEFSGDQYIFLREKDGERTFPIVIGINEALAVDRRLKGQRPARPMTHELLASIIDALGGRLEKIHIEDLRQLHPKDPRQTFIATIFLRRGEQVIEVDSRPSDAIALGAAFNTPIFVAETVLKSVLDDSPEHRVQVLKEHQKMLELKIHQLTERLEDPEFLSQAPPELLEKARSSLDQMKTDHEAIARVLKMLG